MSNLRPHIQREEELKEREASITALRAQGSVERQQRDAAGAQLDDLKLALDALRADNAMLRRCSVYLLY